MDEKKSEGLTNEKAAKDFPDDFWSLESLLPPREKGKPAFSKKSDTSVTDFLIDGTEAPSAGEKIPQRDTFSPITEGNLTREGKMSFDEWLDKRRDSEKQRRAYGKTVVLEYAPGGRFIKKVTVSAETGQRVGSERFITDGQRLRGKVGRFKGNIPFESFYPQYSQLSEAQTECYIGFRTEVEDGRFPEASRSYIYLYLYELINTPTIDPRVKAERLAALINGYKNADDKLFTDMCNWLTDICLIHRVPVPKSIYGERYSRVLEHATLRELFLDGDGAEGDEALAFMLSASRYDYKKSRFYQEYAQYYDRFIPEAVCAEIEKLSKTDSRYTDSEGESCTVTRESYFGAFCSAGARRTVTVEMRCTTKDETVKKTVSDMVKYAENRLRSELMVKPRLTVIYLPIPIRDGIKKFFSERSRLFPKAEAKRYKMSLPEEHPEYERLYEPTESGISEETAREIERESWSITERLTADLEADENDGYGEIKTEESYGYGEIKTEESCGYRELKADKSDTFVAVSEPKDTMPACLSEGGASCAVGSEQASCENERQGVYASALAALLDGDEAEFKFLAKKSGLLPPAFADEINEFIYDIMGDSVITSDGVGYTVTEDYIEDVRDIIAEHRDNI